jgi:hypothetical protein
MQQESDDYEIGTAGSYVLICRACNYIHFRQSPFTQYCVSCMSPIPLDHLRKSEPGIVVDNRLVIQKDEKDAELAQGAQ